MEQLNSLDQLITLFREENEYLLKENESLFLKVETELKQQQDTLNKLSLIINRKSVHFLFRFHGVLLAIYCASLKEKLKIIAKILLRPLGIRKSIYTSDKNIFYKKINNLIENGYDNINELQKCLHRAVDPLLLAKNKLITRIESDKNQGKKIICIMAPIFTNERLKDGYYRRIKAVDDILGDNSVKIYMSNMDCIPEQGTRPVIEYLDETHIKLNYFPWIDDNRIFINEISDHADIVYHHGVGFMDEDIIRKKHLIRIVDLHGALPEEFALSNNYSMVQVESRHEELAMRYADYIICVTNSMSNHMQKKYPEYHPQFIIMPILDDETLQAKVECNTRISSTGKPVITYAGGTQTWQMIPKMQECMRKRPEYDYRIFVPNPQEFWELWGDNEKLNFMRVESLSPEQLREEYNYCHYGFVLREDIVVNNVACPTKLIEYILKGVMPILDTAHIGDFVENGMQYISIKDFCMGNLPEESQRVSIVRQNQEVINKIIDTYQKGCEQIHYIVISGEKKQ